MQPLKSYLTKEGWKLDLEETRIRWLPGSPAEQIRYYIEKVLFKKIDQGAYDTPQGKVEIDLWRRDCSDTLKPRIDAYLTSKGYQANKIE